MQAFVGVDDGNFDIKSQNTSSPNGYTSHKVLPSMAKEYLFYNGTYYLPNLERFNYMEDKTLSERDLILTLFGCAKELIYQAQKRKGDDLQEKILSVKTLALGIGLPPLHWDQNVKKVEYFQKHMGEGIEFNYSGIDFKFTMNFCKIFPQNYAAIVTNANDDIICQYNKYIAVDIGGGTIDIVHVINGKPIVNKCTTDNIGILYMLQDIIYNVKREHNILLTNDDIIDVLQKQPTLLSNEIKERIYFHVQKWVDEKIIDKLIQIGVNFDTLYTIFLGGGSLLLQAYILKNPNIKNIHFLKDPVKANAKGYAILVKKLFYEEKNKK